jgi:hypothetical protein
MAYWTVADDCGPASSQQHRRLTGVVLMPSDAFVLQHSDLNDFLYAEVGEADGTVLTVLSLLARLGLDPWHEAGRIAKLPRKAAVTGLAVMISDVSEYSRSPEHAISIAARLALLLPPRGLQLSNIVPTTSAGAFGGASLSAYMTTVSGPLAQRIAAYAMTRRQRAVLAVALVFVFGVLTLSLTMQQASQVRHSAAHASTGDAPAKTLAGR